MLEGCVRGAGASGDKHVVTRRIQANVGDGKGVSNSCWPDGASLLFWVGGHREAKEAGFGQVDVAGAGRRRLLRE